MSAYTPEQPTQPTTRLPSYEQASEPNAAQSAQAAQEPAYAVPAASPVYPAKPMPTRTLVNETNTYALVAIITTFMMPLAGIIFGHLGLSQIKRTGDGGRGLALTALIYGYAVFAIGAAFVVFYVGFIFMMIGTFASVDSYNAF